MNEGARKVADAMARLGAECARTSSEFLVLAHALGMHDGEGATRGCRDCTDRLRAAGYRTS